MFPVTQEEMYALHAERQREVSRILLEQTLSEAPVVRTWIAMQASRVAQALSRRIRGAQANRTPSAGERQPV